MKKNTYDLPIVCHTFLWKTRGYLNTSAICKFDDKLPTNTGSHKMMIWALS